MITMSLKAKIDEQRLAVNEFRDALEVIEEQPKFRPSNLTPLVILESKLDSAQDEVEKEQRLIAIHESLTEAEQYLETLEAEYHDQLERYESVCSEVAAKAESINAHATALKADMEAFERLMNEGLSLSENLKVKPPANKAIASVKLQLPSIKKQGEMLLLTMSA